MSQNVISDQKCSEYDELLILHQYGCLFLHVCSELKECGVLRDTYVWDGCSEF